MKNPIKLPKFYGRRHGRTLKKGRMEALEKIQALYGINLSIGDIEEKSIDPHQFFEGFDVEKIWLEVGFGNGEHLVAQALANPEIGFIGCEPFINGVSALCKMIEENNIQNIRIWPSDVRPFFDCLTAASLERIFILFPDPWPKKRHQKRRIVNQENLNKISRLLKSQGLLRIATDHRELAEYMLDQCLIHPNLNWTAQSKADWQQPPDDWLVRTRYQEKAKAGHINWFIECVKE